MDNKKTLILLLTLTLATALAAKYGETISWLALIVLGLSAIKFLLVAFQFMELKKAHGAWKFILIAYLVLFVGIVSVILI